MLKRVLLLFFVLLFAISFYAIAEEKKAEGEKEKKEKVEAKEKEKVQQYAFDVGDEMVDFTLPAKSGEKQFSALQGKRATILVFAQSACGACRAEAHHMFNAITESKKKDSISVVFVMVDIGGMEAAAKFVETNKIEEYGTVLFDKEFETGKLYGVYSTPATVIFKDGKISERYMGYNPKKFNIYEVVDRL